MQNLCDCVVKVEQGLKTVYSLLVVHTILNSTLYSVDVASHSLHLLVGVVLVPGEGLSSWGDR